VGAAIQPVEGSMEMEGTGTEVMMGCGGRGRGFDLQPQRRRSEM